MKTAEEQPEEVIKIKEECCLKKDRAKENGKEEQTITYCAIV